MLKCGRGTPRWDDCITYCDKLIKGEGGAAHGTMELDKDLVSTYSRIIVRIQRNIFCLLLMIIWHPVCIVVGLETFTILIKNTSMEGLLMAMMVSL